MADQPGLKEQLWGPMPSGPPRILPPVTGTDGDGGIEVLSIDIARSQMTLMNGTVVTNLTFEAPKATPAPASLPGVPAGPLMAFRPPSPFASAVPSSPGY